MRLGTVTQLATVHGEAICTTPGVCLQRPLAVHSGVAHRRGSMIGHSLNESLQGHVLGGVPSAKPGFFGADKSVLEVLTLLNDKLTGMDASDVDCEALRKAVPAKLKEVLAKPSNEEAPTTTSANEEGPPLPPVGLSPRPRPPSSHARRQNSDSEKRIAAAHGLEDNIHWI